MTRPSTLIPILAAAILALPVGPAAAQSAENLADPDPPGFVQQFDRDGDGRISREEFPGPDCRFRRLDRDGDGCVSAAEAPPGAPGMRHPRGLLQRMDGDADGQVSRDEWLARFQQLDRNGDGFLGAAELPTGRRRPPRRGI
jgi:hypothetical protein